MGILNYTTSVPASKSIGEITTMLAKKQARSITSEFDEEGQLRAISFVMMVGGFPTQFVLPSKSDGVAAVMLRDEPWNTRRSGSMEAYEAKIRAQAVDVGWRIVKDWIEAQLALIESGQADAAQVFMPFARDDNGLTLYEAFVDNQSKRRLASG